jgi:formylmethanofuran dehydrogenase subunit E
MTFTDDPIADFERHDAEQQAKLDKLPLCEYCEEPIQSDYYYEIGNECICEDCLNDNFRKEVEEY